MSIVRENTGSIFYLTLKDLILFQILQSHANNPLADLLEINFEAF